ncbi:MAG: PD-(D/E)XK nuclease family protein, partial [Anaerolineae bacterium]
MIDHLSYSSINTYLLCPRAWRYRYLDKVDVPTSPALIFGSAFHEAVEQYLTMRHSGDELPVAELFDATWETQLEQNDDVDWGDDSEESLLETATRMLTDDSIVAQIDALRPLIIDNAPVIEKYVTITVPGVPIPIVGYIDIITDDGIPGDLKTSGRKWYGDKAEQEMQPVFYLAALNQEGYDLNPELRFRHYVYTKTKSPVVQVL